MERLLLFNILCCGILKFKSILVDDYLFQGIKDEGTTLPEGLAQVFSEDVLIKLGMGSRKCKIHSKKLDKLIKEGVQVSIKTLSKKFQVMLNKAIFSKCFKVIAAKLLFQTFHSFLAKIC